MNGLTMIWTFGLDQRHSPSMYWFGGERSKEILAHFHNFERCFSVFGIS